MIRHVCLGALLLLGVGCAGGTALTKTTQGAHLTAVSVHALVDAEKRAYEAGAIDLDHHAVYVTGLQKLAESEQVLNDALRTWSTTAGQPIPTIVLDAIFSIDVMVKDLTPLVPTTSALTPLLDVLQRTAFTLRGGQ